MAKSTTPQSSMINMELKDFVKESLTQIATGIMEAQEELKGSNCLINPAGFINKNGQVQHEYNDQLLSIQNVKMSISVSVTKASETKVGLSVLSTIANFGLSDKDSKNDNITNRIEFSVPISLPTTVYNPKN